GKSALGDSNGPAAQSLNGRTEALVEAKGDQPVATWKKTPPEHSRDSQKNGQPATASTEYYAYRNTALPASQPQTCLGSGKAPSLASGSRGEPGGAGVGGLGLGGGLAGGLSGGFGGFGSGGVAVTSPDGQKLPSLSLHFNPKDAASAFFTV